MIGSSEDINSPRLEEKLPNLSEAVKWLIYIGNLYRTFNPIMAGIGLVCFFILIFLIIIKKQIELLAPCLIICGLMFSMFVLIGGLSYSCLSAINTMQYHYFCGAFPLMLGSIWFTILYTIQLIWEKRMERADLSKSPGGYS